MTEHSANQRFLMWYGYRSHMADFLSYFTHMNRQMGREKWWFNHRSDALGKQVRNLGQGDSHQFYGGINQ